MKMNAIVREFASDLVVYYKNWDGTHAARHITIGEMVYAICHRRNRQQVTEIENEIKNLKTDMEVILNLF